MSSFWGNPSGSGILVGIIFIIVGLFGGAGFVVAGIVWIIWDLITWDSGD